jgi:hypothetical protein
MREMNSTISSLVTSVNDDEDEKYKKENEILRNLGLFSDTSLEPESPAEQTPTVETPIVETPIVETPTVETPKITEDIDIGEKYNKENEILKSLGLFEERQEPTQRIVAPTQEQDGITIEAERDTGEGFFRQAADLPVKFGIAVNDSLKALTDLFGADNAISQNLSQNSEWYRSLLSAQALKDEEEIARILEEADDKGVLDQIGAGLQAFAVAPLDMTASGLGSLATFVATGVAGRAAAVARAAKLGLAGAEKAAYVAKFVNTTQGLTGAGMGIGIVKGEIYDSVKQEMIDQGKTEEESKKIAMEAQAYNGKNLDQILIAGGLGAADALLGANKIINSVLTKGGLSASASRVKNIIKSGISEAAPEAVQAAQEKFASNLALQREGVDIDLTKGLVSQATLEGVVGGVLGTTAGAVEPRVQPRNNANTKINEIEKEAVKEEELKSRAAEVASLDPTKTATERLQKSSKELELKNIPNKALKVVEEQIKQTKGITAPVDKSADDILVEKAEEFDRTDIKAVELDEESKTQLTNIAENKATPTEVKALKDKGYVYEVEGQLIIPEIVRRGMGKEAPQLNEKARLEEVRDRFKVTNEELNNSTDQDLINALDNGRKVLPKLNPINASRATQSLGSIKNELIRRASIEAETGAGKRQTIDNRYLSTFDTEGDRATFIENKLIEATQNNNTVDLVNTKAKKVNKVIAYDRATGDFVTRNESTGKEERVTTDSVVNGTSRLEIFDSKTSRSRKANEIAEATTQRIAPLPVERKARTIDVDTVQSTPLPDFDTVRGNQLEAGIKAAALRNANATKPLDFLTNTVKQGGVKGRVAELLSKIGVGDVKITIGRFGRAKDTNERFAGKYNRATNEITINLDERDSYTNEDGSHDVESTLLHELGHAALYNKLENKETLDPAESKAIGEIEKIYNEFLKKYADTKSEYSVNTQQVFDEGVGFQEFVAELLVNPELQSLVENIGPDKSLLQKVLQYILNFIQGKELNPYSNLSQAWKALNTLTGRPAVTAEAEVTPTGEAELLSPAVIEENIDSINRMVLSEENIPAAESGILSKLLSASYEIKKLYNGYINQAFINPKTKVDEIVDFIGKTYGIDLVNKKGAIAPSTFLNKITGIREFNPTNLISFTGPNARRNSMIYGLIRSIATKQNGTATYTKDNKGDKVGVRYNFGDNMTPDVAKQVSDVINAVLVQNNAESASSDIAIYPREDGIDVVHLGYDAKIKKNIRKQIFAALNNLNKQLTGRSNKVKEFNVTADYESNDWSKQTKGEKYYEEIDKLIREHPEYKEPTSIQSATDRGGVEEGIGGVRPTTGDSSRRRSDLLRRWMESRITPRITTINAQFSAMGYGNIGADYQVIKVNTPNGDAYIKYYPSAVNLPPLKELESIAGELIAVGEMDTQDADGITMGGGMYPFLLSNDIILTDKNGNKYRVVWANQGTSTKNTIKSKIIDETTSGYMAMHIMQPESQATNAQFFEGILETIVNSNLTAPQLEAVEVISGIVSPKKSDTDYDTKVANLKELNQYVNELVKAGIDSDKINLVNQKYSGKPWYKTNLKNFNERKSNLDFIKKNTTFNSRGLAIGRLKKLKFLGDQIIDKLAQSSDFVNVPSLQIASVVQMSKRPEAFAVWTGKMDLNPTKKWTADDLKAYNDMTETEKDLRKQLINSGKFIAHKSYDWAILGPSNANNFILKTPVQAEQAFTIKMTGDKKELRIQEEPETIDTYNSRNLYALKRGKNINIRVKKKISKPVKTQPIQLQEVEVDREQLAEEAGIEPLAPKEEKDLYSPATDVIKRIFPNTPKRAYTKDFKNWLLRLFTTGNRNQIVQRAVEWIEGKLNSYRFQMESVVKRLKTAAEKDGVNFDDVAEALNKALARNPDDLTEAQRAEIDTIVLNAGNQAIEQFLNGTTETSPTGVNIDGVEFTLPEELKKSSPKYGMGKIQFFSDFDKAAYIIAKDTGKLSKADAKFRKAVQDAGYDIDEVIEHGNKIKAELKKLAGGTAPRTAMNLDLLPQKFDGQSKPYTDRKVKSKSRELTDAELTQIQEAIDATGISPTEAAELVLGEQKFNRLKNYVETVKKQARIDAELEFNKQNLDRAYKEADDALNALPENLRNQILEARAEIKEVTGGVVHDGVIPPNARVVIDGKKVNIAIKEAYYATLDENFIKKLKMDPERIDSLIQYAQDTWINNRANELINESLTNMTRKEAKDLATTELNRLTDEGEINLQDTIESFLNIAATNPTKGFEELLAPSLKMTPDQQAHGLTKALKEALGRVDDNVGYTYISMMHNIAQEITYSEGFNMMRESGLRDGWVVDIKSGDLIPEGFVPIEKSSIPGFSKAFEGMMVDPLFKQEIENTYDSGGKMDGIQKGLNAFNGVTLAAATSLSLPRGPIRNFLGNILFYISAGRIDPRPLAKGMKVAIAALQQSGDAEIIARLKRLIELNLIDQDVTMDILRNSVKGFKGEDINMLENLGETLKPSNIAKVGKFLNRLYQLPDNMWKIALQIAEETTLTEAYKDGIPAKDAGTEVDITFGTPEFKTKIEELAADRVKEAMPAYARMNPIGRFFRKPGMRAFVAPFIGFRSEVLRLQVSNLNLALRDSRSSNPVLRKSGFKRLAGITAAYSTLPIMAAMFKGIFGIGDEEEEAARRTLAPWDQNAELIFYRDKDRNLKYYNMSFANPFAGSSTDALRAARRNYEMNDEKGAKAMTQAIARGLWETFGAYVDPQIFTKKAIEAYSNVSDDGRPVYNPESRPGQIGWDIAGHLYSGIEPGTFKQGMGLINAIMGKEDRRGEIPSLGPAIFNTFLVRSGDVRPAEAFKYKSLEINRRKRDAARIITSLVKRPGPVSDEEITTAYNQANEAYYSILSNANRLYNDQLILGTNKREIITLLKEAGISGDEINQIRRGYIKPYEISDPTLRVIPRDRARLLQKLYREQRRRLASDSNVLTNPKGTNRPNQ